MAPKFNQKIKLALLFKEPLSWVPLGQGLSLRATRRHVGISRKVYFTRSLERARAIQADLVAAGALVLQEDFDEAVRRWLIARGVIHVV